MKNLKLYIGMFLLICSAACSGASLNSGTPPAGKLFAQVALETLGSHHDFAVDDTQIHLEKAAFVIGNLSFLSAAELSALKFHAGEEHEEPSSCSFEGVIAAYFYVNLLEHPTLPCVTLNEGNYTGVSFSIGFPSSGAAVEGLPAGETASFIVEGSATQAGVEYPFVFRGTLDDPVEISQAILLNAETHHLAIKIDLASWFHGLDFSTLEQEGGVVNLNLSQNAEVFEHIVEHFLESFSL